MSLSLFVHGATRSTSHALRRVGLTCAVALGVVALASAPLQAQQTGTVSGQVVSSAGQPLAEVQIVVGDTDLGGLTNQDGRYLVLGVPAGEHVVSATYIGYGVGRETVTVTGGGSVTADFTLQQRAVELEGVVVTGTAIASQRREVGNSIDLISSEEIEAAGVSTLDDLFRVSGTGVSISGSSGQVGAGGAVTLRGINSVQGRNNPLIYVDGVRLNQEGAYESDDSGAGVSATVLGTINPEDIDRIEIIKGAAASTLYGSEAAAGVIQIFTKRGSAGDEVQWTFVSDQALVQPPKIGPDNDPTGLHMNDCTINGPVTRDTIAGPDPDCPESGSWLRNAWSQNYQLSARGGSEDFTFFASGGFNRQEGITNTPDGIDPQQAENVNLRANFSFDSWDQLTLRVTNAYTRRDIRFIPDGDDAEGLLFNVTFLDLGATEQNQDAQVFGKTLDQTIDIFTTGVSLNWQPMDNMRHRFNAGMDWSNSNFRTERRLGYFDPEGVSDNGTSRSVDIETSRVITLDYAGSYLWDVPGLSNVTATTSWGGQLIDRNAAGLRSDVEVFVAPGSQVLENGADITNANEDRFGFINGGFFATQRFGFNNQIFIEAGVRADSHSSYGGDIDGLNANFEYFPKLSATYTLSDYDWWPQTVETFRLRTAWGESGEPPSPDASATYWQIAGSDDDATGFIIQNIANDEIGPERTSEWEGGFDLSAFNGRFALTGTYFYRKTTEGILDQETPASTGVVEVIERNDGEWVTEGLEATVDVNLIDLRDFRLNLNTQYQFIESEMQSLGLQLADDGSVAVPGFGGYGNRYRPGDPFPAYYDNILLNGDAVGELPNYTDDDEFIGRNTPEHEFSADLSANIGSRLTLGVFGYGQFGHFLIDDQAQELASSGLWPGNNCPEIDALVEEWIFAGQPGGEAGLAPLTAGEIAQCSRRFSNNRDWMRKADFFRLSSVSAQYRLPEAWLPGGISTATVQARVNNLAIFTDFPGIDPDALLNVGNQGANRVAGYTLPLPRTFALNLRLTF